MKKQKQSQFVHVGSCLSIKKTLWLQSVTWSVSPSWWQFPFFLNTIDFGHSVTFTNRFHVVMRLFSNWSQMTSKCGKNKKVAHETIACIRFGYLTWFCVCPPLNPHELKWNSQGLDRVLGAVLRNIIRSDKFLWHLR